MRFNYIFALISVLFWQTGWASVSCNPRHQFIGFSKDFEKAYWKTQLRGECDPEIRVIEFDFSSNSAKNICSSKSPEVCTKREKALRRSLIDENEHFKSKFLINGKEGVSVNGLGASVLSLKDNNGSCNLNRAQFSDIEEGSFGPKLVRVAKLNSKYKSWFLITEHCYSAAMAGYDGKNCPTIDGVSIYKAQSCPDKAAM